MEDLVKNFENSLLPEAIPLNFTSINIEYLGKIVQLTGYLKSFSGIVPRISDTWNCGVCNEKYHEKQNSCDNCGNKLFKNTDSSQCITGILEEEYPSMEVNRVPLSIIIKFTQNLPEILETLNLGGKYTLNGPLKTEKKGKSDFFYVEVTEYQYTKEGIEQLRLSEDDIVKIREYSNDLDDLMERLRNTIFGNDIEGLDDIMDSIILMMAGSPKHYVGNKVLKNRGNLMILLAGGPGTGKSQLLKRAAGFYPKARYVSCSGSTAIGLVASVNKDERVGEYVLSPGAVALAHKSIAMIDEIDKINKDDLTKLNTMMDSLIIPIDKANIHRRLVADTSILAAMNPKYGVFDDAESIYAQLNLKKDFLDRFDLVWNMDDYKKRIDGDKLLSRTFDSYGKEGSVKTMDMGLALKYIAYCKRFNPKICAGAKEEIQKEYKQLVSKSNADQQAYMSIRMLDNVVRLALAFCRIKLREEMETVDIKSAIEMMVKSFKSLKIYDAYEGLNQYKSERVLSSSETSKFVLIEKCLYSMGGNRSPVLIEKLKEKYPHDDFDYVLDKMAERGIISTKSKRGMVLLL